VKVETGLSKSQKTGLAGTGEVLPKKSGDFLLDFLLVLFCLVGQLNLM